MVPIAVLAIIYSGFLFVAAKGNPGKLEEAKKIFYFTLIGIAILLGAEILSKVIESTVTSLK